MFIKKIKAMLHQLFYGFAQLPMLWDLILPLAALGVFCTVLFYEGERGTDTHNGHQNKAAH